MTVAVRAFFCTLRCFGGIGEVGVVSGVDGAGGTGGVGGVMELLDGDSRGRRAEGEGYPPPPPSFDGLSFVVADAPQGPRETAV